MTQTIAQTILTQLGGNTFCAMTGAKGFMAHTDGALSFKLPRFDGLKINSVKVSYDEAHDLYDMSFDRLYGMKMSNIKKVDGVCFDQLQEIFTRTTGLDTHL